MNRFKPFVVLDVLVTLPLCLYAVHETFTNPPDGMLWLALLVLGGFFTVMLPSLVCLAGRTLNPVVAGFCLLVYLVMMIFLWFRVLACWHQPHHAGLICLGLLLLIAKSIYGAVSVTKHNT